ncbi:MAG TPA: hypothetical protein ENI96_00960 [Sedimenticola thiotaurini]|uniref:YchJ-like middle NTF2-like domain-containing protein n=1 Tax=Sedimenticola thiotaurini TaxID=1543721 RepID=A0A831RJE5_9GAMM|nr:hypothetical protein [Sedimenticola thiotaurini]
MSPCPCGSGLEFDACCGPVLAGERPAATAEALMRARYTAFTRVDMDFLGDSLHPAHRHDHDEAATRRWAEESDWMGLEVVATKDGGEGDQQGEVEFIASYRDRGGMVRRHHERSRFQREGGRWYFVDGRLVPPKTAVHSGPRVGRNDPCPCGSGRKYKKCCGR